MINSTLTIFQQNVINWKTNKHSIIQSIINENTDIVLINSSGTPDNIEIIVPEYNVIQSNHTGENSRGSAICIKKSLKYKKIPNISNDFLAVQLQLKYDNITVATYYNPPRLQNNFPYEELKRLYNRAEPMYFIGDLNAVHQFIGHNRKNYTGEVLNQLMINGKNKTPRTVV